MEPRAPTSVEGAWRLVARLFLAVHAVCALSTAAAAAYWLVSVFADGFGSVWATLPPIAFVATAAMAILLLLRAPRRRLSWSLAVYTVLAGAALYLAFEFFVSPMHDVALAFGSHGRFGCRVVGPEGVPTTWLDQDTLPWLMFALPPAGAVAASIAGR